VGPLDIVTPRQTSHTFYYIDIPCVCYNEVRNNIYSDAWNGSRQTQSRPAGAVASKEAGSANPEMFRRGWEAAGPPSPELPPNLDDGKGQNATI